MKKNYNHNRWILTDSDRKEYDPVIRKYLNYLENLSVEQVESLEINELILNLSDTGLNPYKTWKLLEEYGYEKVGLDKNGWELDFWIDMERTDGKMFDSTCERLCVYGCGMTFELKVCPREFI